MFLLDTNVVSESRKLGTARIDPNVERWLAGVDAEASFLSAMTIFELERGVRQMERRDPAQGGHLRRWLEDRVYATFAGRTLPLSHRIALVCADLHVPDPRSERDAWIAATALDAGLTLATRNVADFAGMNVTLVNPFASDPTGTAAR